MIKVLSICFLALPCLKAAGQSSNPPLSHSFQIIGQVTDSAGYGLVSSTIQYAAAPDTLHTLTDDNGVFTFPRLPSRKFALHVTMKGYVSITQTFQIGPGKSSIRLPTIVLQTDYLDLQPVVISQVRPVTFSEDTVSYNVAAFPVRDGSTVQDILKRLPGIEVDMDGNVMVQGKKITKALVDGKEFFGGDVLLAIQNLPVDVVRKLQVIDDYGDKARFTGVYSGDADKVLNIVLKSDKHSGLFANMDAAAGNQGKYIGSAFANAFDGERQIAGRCDIRNNSPVGSDYTESGGINYANQWGHRWGLASSISNSGQSPHSIISTVTDSYYPGEQLQQSQENHNEAHNTQTNLNSRLTYKPDGYTTFRLTTSGSLEFSNNKTSGNFATLQEESGYNKTTDGTSTNQTKTSGPGFRSNVYFEKSFPTDRRRFSMEVDFQYKMTNFFTDNQSRSAVMTDSNASNSYLYYVTLNATRTWNTLLNATYFLPLGRTSFIELGFHVQESVARTALLTLAADSAGTPPVPVDSLSQKTLVISMTQNAHMGYTAKIRQLNITAALDVQPGQLKGSYDAKGGLINYTYFSVLPSLTAAWNFDKSRRLRIVCNGRPTLPSLQQLSPITNLSTPQYPITGNPDLKQSYTYNVYLNYEQSELKATQFFGYGFGLGYTETLHTIISNLDSPKDSSQVIQATTYLNAGTTNNLTLDYHLTLPSLFRKRFRVMLGANIGRSESITMTNRLQYQNQSWTWAPYIHLQLIIPDLIETDLSGNYDVARTVYSGSPVLPNTFRSATINFTSRHTFLRKWTLNYQFLQSFASDGSRLQTIPPSFTASIQRQFLPRNRATLTLAGYNLFNQTAAVGQSVSPTTIVQSTPQLTGRYMLVSFQLKLQRFH